MMLLLAARSRKARAGAHQEARAVVAGEGLLRHRHGQLLAAATAWPAGSSVVHCSGATEVQVLASVRERDAVVGGFLLRQLLAGLDRG